MVKKYLRPAKKLDWGQAIADAIRDACEETGLHATALYKAVGTITDDSSKNTIASLRDYEEVPPAGSKDAERAVVLLIGIGASPEQFDLSLDDLSPIRRKAGPDWIRREIHRLWTTSGASPERRSSGLVSVLT